MNKGTPTSRNARLAVGLLALILIFAALFALEPLLTLDEVAKPAKPQLFKEAFFKRLIYDIVAVFVLVMFVYLPIHRKKDYFFTFIVLNFLVFIITYLMSRTSAFGGWTTGLGLLAFFSLLRLRTDTISMKDMTYLFIVLTIGLVNASMTGPDHELVTLNAVIVALAYGLDKDWLSKSIHMREMKLESLEYIVPEKMEDLVASLRAKTGLDIQRVKILSVDLGKKCAIITIFHY
jgi:Domain of unknown function (DUF4956)